MTLFVNDKIYTERDNVLKVRARAAFDQGG